MPRRKGFKLRLKDKTSKTILGLLIILVGGLSFLSFFGQVGLARQLREILFTAFGWVTFLVPIALVLAGLLFTKIKLKFVSPNTVFGFWGFLLSILSLSASFNKNNAGLVGRKIWELVSTVLSSPGAFFVLLVLSLVSIVVFFNTSLEGASEFITKAWQVAKEWWQKFFARSAKADGDLRQVSFETRGGERAERPAEEISTTALSNLPGSDKVWEYPPLDLLSDTIGSKAERGDIKQNAATIEKTLESFGITAKVVEVNMGPAVTQYALEIAVGTRLTKITSLANDIALALAAPHGQIRIEAPIPGKSLVGIEVPNIKPE